ncbi:MAG: hypothetical protein IM545_01820 [Chitinophagaceae bacterium]|jgi:hypothetical protein|nr:hypothetical protein [Chitinophagaceae bacterium]MCA6499096.1 hypothetical protein [Chitinophagaceae bacterium]MCE2973980.1 hypothetical protein [Sediminibacterium sp.]
MNKFSILFYCCASILLLSEPVIAQNNTSPYSMLGIGDLEKSNFDRTSGMGHAGVALSSNRFIYQANPASFAALDEHFLFFEASARFKNISYTGTPITDLTSNVSNDLQFKKVSLGTKVTPRWAVGFGLNPYSTVSYSFAGVKAIQGSNLFADAFYSGTGSTSLASLTNSYAVSKNLQVGLQTSFVFGHMEESETLAGQLADSLINTVRNRNVGQARFKFGAQYKTALNKQWDVALGGTYTPKTNLWSNTSLKARSGNTVLLQNDFYESSYFTLPVTYQVGMATTFKKAFTLALDYQYEGWRQTNYRGASYILDDSRRYSGGFEYSKKGTYLDQAYEKFFLQTGVFYTDSYLRINGVQIKDYGITLGAGAELSRTPLSSLAIQAALELGVRGTTNKGLIRESYSQFTLSLCYRDFWLSRKLKRYD